MKEFYPYAIQNFANVMLPFFEHCCFLKQWTNMFSFVSCPLSSNFKRHIPEFLILGDVEHTKSKKLRASKWLVPLPVALLQLTVAMEHHLFEQKKIHLQMVNFSHCYVRFLEGMSGVTTAWIGLVTDSGPCCCEGDQFLCCRVIQVPKLPWEMVGTQIEHPENIPRFHEYVFTPKLQFGWWFSLPFLETIEVQTLWKARMAMMMLPDSGPLSFEADLR